MGPIQVPASPRTANNAPPSGRAVDNPSRGTPAGRPVTTPRGDSAARRSRKHPRQSSASPEKAGSRSAARTNSVSPAAAAGEQSASRTERASRKSKRKAGVLDIPTPESAMAVAHEALARMAGEHPELLMLALSRSDEIAAGVRSRFEIPPDELPDPSTQGADSRQSTDLPAPRGAPRPPGRVPAD